MLSVSKGPCSLASVGGSDRNPDAGLRRVNDGDAGHGPGVVGHNVSAVGIGRDEDLGRTACIGRLAQGAAAAGSVGSHVDERGRSVDECPQPSEISCRSTVDFIPGGTPGLTVRPMSGHVEMMSTSVLSPGARERRGTARDYSSMYLRWSRSPK